MNESAIMCLRNLEKHNFLQLQEARKEFMETPFELHFQEWVGLGHMELEGKELS